ncbi:hypothetical protein AA103196_0727 [Ameyamaea chiangmaiensis NBRC 103196]|uniref:Uncharacterized protein n=1 Tax=Ameyamaea chiangmaiensis TaxID=442969 RepID=A0A850P9R9_9PROT|nr:hypothetical protein [Ameyamaea chiangmaiensis]MBS4075829.1 hypothetical protein [Ameyamaea chiangmaiensis]NVN39300.1 hypothetical protein [Ameyamaea chiangmaiensis]GBQ63902.1 hypothetical protein AA103196_0727 [Ameyamaea chiangmaiensis NBRC 103196]
MSTLYDVSGSPLLATDGQPLLDTGIVPYSQRDFARRIRALLPNGWFPAPPGEDGVETAPVLDGVLNGIGFVFAWIFSLLTAVQAQTRIASAYGGFLDMIAADFFGAGVLPRLEGEGDVVYRARIVATLKAPMNTRQAVTAAIAAVTGVQPVVIEPWSAQDCGGLGARVAPGRGGGRGYGTRGLRYGTLGGGQFFVETGISSGASSMAVRSAITRTKALGIIGWLKVES